MITNQLKNYNINSRIGFTLVEVMVSMSIFVIASVVISSIFLDANRLQKNTASLQRLQNDGRYIIEKLAREIRAREIDYPLTNTNPQDYLNFKRDEMGDFIRICFEEANKKLNYYIETISDGDNLTRCLSSGEPMNASDVEVLTANFFVIPTRESQWGSEPINNLQPRVAILLKIKNKASDPRYIQELSFQTTISSKVYKR